MHSAKPFGLSVEGGELTDRDRAYINVVVRRFSNFKDANRLDSYRKTDYLPDGGYFVVSDMAGIFKVMAYKRVDKRFKYDGLAKMYIPMLFSGRITNAKPWPHEGVELQVSEQTRQRISQYGEENRPAKALKLNRFVIGVNNNVVPEFQPKNENANYITTQFVQQRPTWYSGAMAELIQIVGGYGRQDFDQLPDNEIERSELRLPDALYKQIEQSIQHNLLPAYTGVPPISGEFQFDYKFGSTHGITFDHDNNPWLIHVRYTGVWAMPLPIVPATKTEAFRMYIEEKGDDEILAILDRFGAMPSGEGFPESLDDFFTWERAGVIIKVCDSADFYNYQAYTNACGWSFNLNGTEGINTCYGTHFETGISIGYTYSVNLQFKTAENRGILNKVSLTQDEGVEVAPYLSQLLAQLPAGTVKAVAILYKLRRSSIEFIRSRINVPVNEDEINFWHNLKLDPIAKHTGRIVKTHEGYLYHNAKPNAQPQIKFPVVEIPGCISFDFGAFKPVPVDQRPNCDTIMYGYYIGDSIKVVKYFVDWRSYIKESDSNFEPVMTVGSWEKTETTGQSSPQGHFYISDLDLREVYDPVTVHTKIIGRDKGFDSKPFFGFDHFFSMSGSVWRNRYYTHETIVNRSAYESIGLAICIPYLMRNTAVLAVQKNQTARSKQESLGLLSIQDPTSYRMWTYDFVFAWNNPLEKMTGKPYPVNGNPVWVEIKLYAPSETNDFADQGPWLPDLPYDMTWLVHPNANEWQHSGGGGAPKVNTYSRSTGLPDVNRTEIHASIIDQPALVSKDRRVTEYFLPSPNEFGDVMIREGCKAVFGQSIYANISEGNVNFKRVFWGYSRLADHSNSHHFIGVINE